MHVPPVASAWPHRHDRSCSRASPVPLSARPSNRASARRR
jgi:hypothetical protein